MIKNHVLIKYFEADINLVLYGNINSWAQCLVIANIQYNGTSRWEERDRGYNGSTGGILEATSSRKQEKGWGGEQGAVCEVCDLSLSQKRVGRKARA